VIHKNPDVVIVTALGDDLKPFEKMVKNWSSFSQMKAVKTKRVYV